MLYRLEQRIEGAWRLLKEVTSWDAWSEVSHAGRGSFRLVDPRSGVAEREIHVAR